MFESVAVAELSEGSVVDLDAFEQDLSDWPAEPSWGAATPSGLAALELDDATSAPRSLSDAELIEAVVGFERLAAWAQARQARLLAEFAHRRPGDDKTLVATDRAMACSPFAPDEVGLALSQSRLTAKARLGRSVQLRQVLTQTLEAWQVGRLDERKVSAICDATHFLPEAKARAVEQRVLPRARRQTLAQLRASLRRAVMQVDPEGAAERHRAARRERRVAVGEEQEGMASLWALLSAPDARSCYQWLTRLALGCGSQDPRGMDARRADLLVALLTGSLTHAAGEGRTPGGRTGTHQPPERLATPTAATTGPAGSGDGAGSDGFGGAAGAAALAAPARSADAAVPAVGDGAIGPAGEVVAVGRGAERPAVDCAAAGNGADAPATGAAAGGGGSGGVGGGGPARPVPGAGPPPGGDALGAAGPAVLPRPVNPGKPLVQVLVPFSTLIGADDQPCELVGHGPISASLAREIAADATLRRLVYDPLSGTVLDYGRTTYRPPAGLADHVRARDVHCRNPICRRRAIDGHLDHIDPYPHGPTSEQNLAGYCGHDHRVKHAPGWQVRALPDGRLEWITPTGHRYSSHPYDYRPDPEPGPDVGVRANASADAAASPGTGRPSHSSAPTVGGDDQEPPF